jgi:hypothetical protein
VVTDLVTPKPHVSDATEGACWRSAVGYERGRNILERNRHEREQHFYSGLQRQLELLRDAKVYQAYEREAEWLREDGAVIDRVMLDIPS